MCASFSVVFPRLVLFININPKVIVANIPWIEKFTIGFAIGDIYRVPNDPIGLSFVELLVPGPFKTVFGPGFPV
jgi:hypothetical protein